MKTVLIIILSIMLSSCAGLKIETGQTAEEATLTADQAASRMRAEWADGLRRTEDHKLAERYRELFRRAMDSYRFYGRQILREWEAGEKGRGEVISSDEMRKMIKNWKIDQHPQMLVYDDMMEYTYALLKEKFPNDEILLTASKKLLDLYYSAYTGFFYPTGNINDYRNHLEESRLETGDAINEFTETVFN